MLASGFIVSVTCDEDDSGRCRCEERGTGDGGSVSGGDGRGADLDLALVREIRSPLSTVLMTLDMLELQLDCKSRVAKPLTKAEQHRLVRGAQESCTRILEVLDSISGSSEDVRDAGGRMRCPIAPLVRDIVRSVCEPGLGPGVEIVVEDGLTDMFVGPDGLRYALGVLLRCAVRGSGEGGRVVLEVRRAFQGVGASERLVAFSVSCAGVGSEQPGSDELGLVERFAVAHGGCAGIKSWRGDGWIATIALPTA